MTDFSHGASVYGLPVLPAGIPPTTGKVFFVSNRSGDSGSDGNDGLSAKRPFSTLAKAVSLMSSGRGDIAIVMPGHAETITTTVTPVAGSSIIGLGWGRARPAFTGSGAIDVFTVSAANVQIHNVRIVGASADVTALVDLTGDDAVFRRVSFEPLATPLMSVTASGADRCVFEDCNWYSVTNGPDCGIELEGGCDNWIVRRCTMNFSDSGLDLAGIRGNAVAAVGWLIEDCTFLGMDATAIDFNSSGANANEGLINRVSFFCTAAITSIEDAVDQGTYICVDVKGSDAKASAGARVPLASAA